MVRACGAIVGARRASPAVCGAHVLRLFAALLSLAARRTRIAHIAIIHSQTSLSVIVGEA